MLRCEENICTSRIPKRCRLARQRAPGHLEVSVVGPSSAAAAVLYSDGMAKISSRSKALPARRPKAHLVSSRTVYRGPVFWVTTDHVIEPGGIKVRRDLIHHSGSIVMLAVDDTRKVPRVLLERQYRHAAKDYLWELPAGRIDPGESELHAAKRELIEETGYRADRWRRILRFYASPGFVAETMAVYLATGLHAGEAEPEDDEVIYKRMLPLPTVVKMVMKGTIRDAKTRNAWAEPRCSSSHTNSHD